HLAGEVPQRPKFRLVAEHLHQVVPLLLGHRTGVLDHQEAVLEDEPRVYADSGDRRSSKWRRKSSSQAARSCLPLILPLLRSWRSRETATRRSVARFSAAVRSLSRQSSSRKMTSSTQCRPFSMPQCSRAAPPSSKALPLRLLM